MVKSNVLPWEINLEKFAITFELQLMFLIDQTHFARSYQSACYIGLSSKNIRWNNYVIFHLGLVALY